MQKKIIKIVISIMVVFLLVGCSVNKSDNTNGGFYDYSFISDDTAVLYDLPIDFKIEVISKSNKFYIVDNEDVAVKYQVEEKDDRKIITGENGRWEQGKKYTIILNTGDKFFDKDIKNYNTLRFSIKRENIEKIEYENNVIDFYSENKSVDINKLPNEVKKEGNIVIFKNEYGKYDVTKISGVNSDGSINVTIPKLDEVIKNIDVYGRYNSSIKNIIKDEDIKIQLKNNIRKSEFFEFLVMTAYADDFELSLNEKIKNTDIEVKLNDKDDNVLSFEIIIKFHPTTGKIFGENIIKHHDIKLSFNVELKQEVLLDCTDVNNININVELQDKNNIKLDVQFKDDNENTLNKVLNKLQEEYEVIEKKVHLFDMPVVIPALPMINITTEVFFVPKFSLSIDVNYEHNSTMKILFGVSIKNGNVMFFKSFQSINGSNYMKFDGKSNASIGIAPNVNVNIINDKLMYTKLNTDFGVYVDLKGNVEATKVFNEKIKTKDEVKIEFGGYGKADAKVYLNLLVHEVNNEQKLFDEKIVFYQFEAKNSTGLQEARNSKTNELYGYYEFVKDLNNKTKSLILYDVDKNEIDKMDFEYKTDMEVGGTATISSSSKNTFNKRNFYLQRYRKIYIDNNKYQYIVYNTKKDFEENIYNYARIIEDKKCIRAEHYGENKKIVYAEEYKKDNIVYKEWWLTIYYDEFGNEKNRIEHLDALTKENIVNKGQYDSK